MCRDCTKAAERRWHGFTADCPGCAARAVARGPNYRASRDNGQPTWQYRAELQQMQVTHQQVRAAAAIDERLKA